MNINNFKIIFTCLIAVFAAVAAYEFSMINDEYPIIISAFEPNKGKNFHAISTDCPSRTGMRCLCYVEIPPSSKDYLTVLEILNPEKGKPSHRELFHFLDASINLEIKHGHILDNYIFRDEWFVTDSGMVSHTNNNHIFKNFDQIDPKMISLYRMFYSPTVFFSATQEDIRILSQILKYTQLVRMVNVQPNKPNFQPSSKKIYCKNQ